MLIIMYNNAIGEYFWVLTMPNILCYQEKVSDIYVW